MSDEKRWCAPGASSAYKPRVRQPGELLFEFCRERDHTRWGCELRDHREELGVEAQIFRNEEFPYSRRFDPRLDAGRPSRELAIQWAEESARRSRRMTAAGRVVAPAGRDENGLA